MGRQLIISDLHLPFEHPRALEFCRYLKRHFKITEVYCGGDELDLYFGSQWKKDINTYGCALGELSEAREKLKPWYAEFPTMRLCNGNHTNRWKRRALESDIPEILMRRYEEVIAAPSTWTWADRWRVNETHPYMVEHGDCYGTQYPHVQAALNNGISMAIFHFHTLFGVEHVHTRGMRLWAAVGGSLINNDASPAFDYDKKSKRRPVLGSLVVLDNGALPLCLPMV